MRDGNGAPSFVLHGTAFCWRALSKTLHASGAISSLGVSLVSQAKDPKVSMNSYDALSSLLPTFWGRRDCNISVSTTDFFFFFR